MLNAATLNDIKNEYTDNNYQNNSNQNRLDFFKNF